MIEYREDKKIEREKEEEGGGEEREKRLNVVFLFFTPLIAYYQLTKFLRTPFVFEP